MQAITASCQHVRVRRLHVRPQRCHEVRKSPLGTVTGWQGTLSGLPAVVTPWLACKRASCKLHAQEYGGSPLFEGSVVAEVFDQKFAVVVARFNDLVTGRLLDGALATFKRHGVAPEDVSVAWVPGSFELPLVAKAMAKSRKFAAVVAIGAVVRGATTHYDAVVSGATSGLLDASVSTGVPVVFGVLTCDTMEQALDRAGGKVGNKGGEAAITAIEMANLLKGLRAAGKAADVGLW